MKTSLKGSTRSTWKPDKTIGTVHEKAHMSELEVARRLAKVDKFDVEYRADIGPFEFAARHHVAIGNVGREFIRGARYAAAWWGIERFGERYRKIDKRSDCINPGSLSLICRSRGGSYPFLCDQ